MIYDGDSDEDIGIPIGNYTSQYFANIYLHELDKYVKYDLGVKYYVRYMDDFILLFSTKEECKKTMKLIEEFLHQHLFLSYNRKSRYYPNKMGVDFCGYKIHEDYSLLRTRSKTKMKKKIKVWNCLYEHECLDIDRAQRSWNAWKAHAKHANTYSLRKRLREHIVPSVHFEEE